jgi:hypothetical protein
MRSVIGFFSLLAFGFLAAGVIAVMSSGTAGFPLAFGGEDHKSIDLASLLVGLALGLLLSAVARISWSELPHRFASWLLTNERRLYRIAWAGLFVAVLFYY